MSDWEWTLTIETGQKGGPGSGHHGHAGRPGQRGGSAPGKGRGSATWRRKEEWAANLTEAEKTALFHWGQTGYGIRKIQSGHPEKIADDRLRERAQRDIQHWESAMEKGVPFRGVVYRGLSGIPGSVIGQWRESGQVSLNNDQSATKAEELGKDFALAGPQGNRDITRALWKCNQRSGVDLFGQTNVTEGGPGKWVAEQEVVLRKGTTYRIKSMTYLDKSGNPWPPANYFEGTEWSLDNPPPGWQPHRDKDGYYLMEMEEA